MYKISFSKKAFKILSKLGKPIQNKIIKYLEQKELLKNPTAFGKMLLYKKKGNWRFRVGDYRIITKIFDDKILILIVDLGHRKEIYE